MKNRFTKTLRVAHSLCLLGLCLSFAACPSVGERPTPVTPPASMPPDVVSITPTADSTGIGLDDMIEAEFTEQMNAESISGSTFLVRAGTVPVSGTVAYNSTTNTAIFDPKQSLAANTTYTARLDGMEDADGNELVTYIWTFKTGN